MRFSSAAFSLGRVHVTRATIRGLHSLSPFKSISLGERRRFAEVVSRNKSTMTPVDASSGRSGRPFIDTNVLIGVGTLVVGLLGHYFAISIDFDSKIKDAKSDVVKMLESKLDAQDRKLDSQDRKVDGIEKNVDLLPLKFELKKYWNYWFGFSASPVMSKDENVSDIVSKVSKNLDAKVADLLEAMLKELKDKIGDQDRVNDDNSSKK
jgi:hypothetical protein